MWLMEYITNTIAKREEGQTMVEYGLILALISIAALAVMTPLGDAISGIFTEVTAALD